MPPGMIPFASLHLPPTSTKSPPTFIIIIIIIITVITIITYLFIYLFT